MNEEKIKSVRSKIAWQEARSVEFVSKGASAHKELTEMKANGVDEDSEQSIRARLKFHMYKDLSEALRSRALEVNCIIESMQRPEDPYLRAHASTISSDTKVGEMKRVWNQYIRIAGTRYP